MLKLWVLGQNKCEVDGEAQQLQAKPLALLVYLLINPQPKKQIVTDIFFSNEKSLTDTRRALPKPFRDAIRQNGDSLEFVQPEDFWCDLVEFYRLTEQIPTQKTADLQQAFDLYGGELALRVPNASPAALERWLAYTKRNVDTLYAQVAEQLRKNYLIDRQAELLLRLTKIVKDRAKSLHERETHLLMQLRLLGILGQFDEAEYQYRQYLRETQAPEEATEAYRVIDQIRFHQGDSQLSRDLWRALIQSDANCPTPQPPKQLQKDNQPFFAKRKESRRIYELVTQPGRSENSPRIIVVAGMGGIGKSSLVRNLALEHGGDLFRNGVLWGRLNNKNSENGILRNWVSRLSLGVNSSSMLLERFQDLTNACARLHVIEDDGEYASAEDGILQLPDEGDKVVDRVKQLIPLGASNTVIVTTRNEYLYTALKNEYDDVHFIQITPVEISVANRIFRKYAKQLIPPEETQPVVKALGCLPLAVELAGKFIYKEKVSPAQYLKLFKNDNNNLRDVLRTLPEVFDVTRNALHDQLKIQFDKLSVFDTRSFDVAAVAAVWDCDVVLANIGLRELSSLSIVVQEGQRYRLHPLIARFAKEQLKQNAIADENALANMLTYYLTLPQPNLPLATLVEEQEALEYSLDMAYKQGLYDAYLDCVKNSQHLWTSQGFYDAARSIYIKASDAARQLGDNERVIIYLVMAAETLLEQGGEAAYQQARELMDAARMLINAQDSAVGRFYVQRARVRLALEVQDTTLNMREELARLDDLMEELHENASDDIQIDYIERRSWIIHQMFYENRQHELAIIDHLFGLMDESIQRLESFGDSYNRNLNLIRCLGKQNGILLRTLNKAEYPNSAAIIATGFERIRQLCSQINEYAELAPVLYYQSIYCRLMGQREEAYSLADESEAMYRRLGDRKGLARVLRLQVRHCGMRGEWHRGYTIGKECQEVIENHGLINVEYSLYAEVLYATAYCAVGECHFAEAVEGFEAVLRFTEEAADKFVDRPLWESFLQIAQLARAGKIDQALALNASLPNGDQLPLDCLS